MKKLILILLYLPLFVFSQEEKAYAKTMSVSQFAKELKQAADKGIGYTLQDCQITYDTIRDKKYLLLEDENTFYGDMIIRALNSIVLSINAFSTLGFGQIPVRGFTKYVAIIEGFIGWFMLSIFLVSVLSQMMSV